VNAQATQNPSRQAVIPEAKSIVPPVARPSSRETASSPQSAVQSDSSLVVTTAHIEPEQRCAMIAEAAYYRAEHRGFEQGHELEDWCLAEGEIDTMLTSGAIPVACGPCS
jgi:hypothetical protein